jgi:hypothetical protein
MRRAVASVVWNQLEGQVTLPESPLLDHIRFNGLNMFPDGHLGLLRTRPETALIRYQVRPRRVSPAAAPEPRAAKPPRRQ